MIRINNNVTTSAGKVAPLRPMPAKNPPLETRLAAIDLNLFVALEALLACQNVSRAAQRLGITQPAMSRSLARLRELFGDELLIRGGSGMQLTTRGEVLRKSLRTAMTHVRNAVSLQNMHSETKLTVAEGLAPTLLPTLLVEFTSPTTSLRASTFSIDQHAIEQLLAGTVDFAVGGLHDISDGISSLSVCSEPFITVISPHHHGASVESERAFLRFKHVCLMEMGHEMFPQVNEALSARGVKFSRIVELSNIMSAALLSAEGEVALTVPRSVARWLTSTLSLVPVAPPLSMKPYQISVTWADRSLCPKREHILSRIVATARERFI